MEGINRFKGFFEFKDIIGLVETLDETEEEREYQEYLDATNTAHPDDKAGGG